MRVVISQPFYLPWPGLFEQIRHCDVWVHLNHVLYPKGSLVQRVQIKTPPKVTWLSMKTAGRSIADRIADVKILDAIRSIKEQTEKIGTFLGKAPFFSELQPILDCMEGFGSDSLAELNILLIELISERLGLKTRFCRSDELGISSKSSQMVLDICQHYGATRYITGHGAKNYLDHEIFEKNNINVEYMNYQIQPYQQLYGEFTPYVTVLDLIANTGPNATNHLQSTTIPWRNFLSE